MLDEAREPLFLETPGERLVVAAARRARIPLEFGEAPIGGASIDALGTPLADDALDAGYRTADLGDSDAAGDAIGWREMGDRVLEKLEAGE